MFPIKKIKEKLFNIGERIIITCKFPGIPGEQEVAGIIRNIVKAEEDVSIGIEFDDFAWWAPPY